MQKARLFSLAQKDLAAGHSPAVIIEEPESNVESEPIHAEKEDTMEELVEKLSLRDKELLEKNTKILEQEVVLQTTKILLDKSQDSVQAAKERGNMWHEKYRTDHKKIQ
jgi:hypothetical protein